MKYALKILVIALTTLGFSGVSFAQAKPATPATSAAPATEKKTEMKTEKAKKKTIEWLEANGLGKGLPGPV